MANRKLKLFAVRNDTTRKLVTGEDGEPEYHSDKRVAKNTRDNLREDSDTQGYSIVLGPDHRRFRRVGFD